MGYRIIKTPEFHEWFIRETPKSKVQIESRLSKIEIEGYFGETKELDNEIFELKWKNGRRVYFAYIPESKVLLLLGGNKNGQSKDIHQAKKIYKKHTQD